MPAEPGRRWSHIQWHRVNRTVSQLRRRIYRATVAGDVRQVRNLQKLLLRSWSNRMLAVRRVTQVSQGRRPPGVDGQVVNDDRERFQLLQRLAHHHIDQVRPVKRVIIPKGHGQHRPLGIPTLIDRCQQAVVLSALEPHWEAKFEATSYGFRPGRSAHDAIQRVWSTLKGGSHRLWVLDADIEGAFNHIDHAFLMQAIRPFPGRAWIRRWLQAGVMERGRWRPTKQGAPQGGVISPLLLNIALHGLESQVGMVRYPSNGQVAKHSPYVVVRHADDFVVMAHSYEACQRARRRLHDWLRRRGLKLSAHKTQISHVRQGFEFLGYQVRQYRVSNRHRGVVLLIQPSKAAVQQFKRQINRTWRSLLGETTRQLIDVSNSQIRGWCQYHRVVCAKTTFSALNHWMWTRQHRYLRRRHPNESWWWFRKRYWGSIPGRRDRWVFMDKATHTVLGKLAWTRIQRHVLVKGRHAPDNPDLKGYWQQRHQRRCRYQQSCRARLWHRQRGLCPTCRMPLGNGEQVDLHHIRPRHQGGDDQLDNLCLMHAVCHRQWHRRHQQAAGQSTA